MTEVFLTTRETFPGEKSFTELSAGFFSGDTSARRSASIADKWGREGLLVHMANPEQIDDLFAHIDREKIVRYLSTSYLHSDIRATVYAIGRGTGLILDRGAVTVEHVSLNDAGTVTDADGRLIASNHALLPSVDALREALKSDQRKDWSEVNVSFEGASPILGFFSLDGVMSKLYGATLYLKAGRRLPVFAYNRELNRLAEFLPDFAAVSALISQVPVTELRERYQDLLKGL